MNQGLRQVASSFYDRAATKLILLKNASSFETSLSFETSKIPQSSLAQFPSVWAIADLYWV